MGILNRMWVRVLLLLLVTVTTTGAFFLLQDTGTKSETTLNRIETNSSVPTFTEQEKKQYNTYRDLGYEPAEALSMVKGNSDDTYNPEISDVKSKKFQIQEWDWDIVAVVFWLVILAYPTYFLWRYACNKYFSFFNPLAGLSRIQELLETNQKQYVEILAKYDMNETPSSMRTFIKEIMETDAQLVNKIRNTKIKERFNKKELRRLFTYISDYVKLQTKLVDSPDWQEDDSDYKKNTNYLEMQEILKAIS